MLHPKAVPVLSKNFFVGIDRLNEIGKSFSGLAEWSENLSEISRAISETSKWGKRLSEIYKPLEPMTNYFAQMDRIQVGNCMDDPVPVQLSLFDCE